ncbi:MAG TPA: LLM class flavin-dependent oxidoreductase [Candidatus Limnocylindrales bacterium]|nr:LLM class flavin-dependent oxidoreductase [Candidatus Limnocylindrales bacterium]
MQIGVLLPHFGAGATRERLFGFSDRLEALGFDAVWARDQVGFRGGHAFESEEPRFVDPWITLAAIAARNPRLILGTAPVIPIRHPVLLAQLVGSLAFLAGDRLILGLGAGTPRRPFELTGIPYEERFERIREVAEVLRTLAHPPASYAGQSASFEDLTIDPPPPADLELWYGGTTFRSVERALAIGTGWLPGRCPLPVLDEKLARLRALAAEAGRTMKVGIIPIVSIDQDRETALAQIDVAGLLEEARHKAHWARFGPFEAADDLAGVIVAGSPDDVVAQLGALAERGIDHVVLDLRLRPDAYERSLELIGREVLPGLGVTPPREAGASRRRPRPAPAARG